MHYFYYIRVKINYFQGSVRWKQREIFLQTKPPWAFFYFYFLVGWGGGRCFIINVIQEPNFEFCSAGCFNLFLLSINEFLKRRSLDSVGCGNAARVRFFKRCLHSAARPPHGMESANLLKL